MRAAVLLRIRPSALPGVRSPPPPADAKAFLDAANETTLRLGVQQAQAGWVQQTYITADTEALAARTSQAANEAGVRFAKEATGTTASRCRRPIGGS